MEEANARSILLLGAAADSVLLQLFEALKTWGYRVLVADNAEEAVASFISESPTAVIADAGLRGLDGLDLIRRLKELDRNAVIFLLGSRGIIGMAIAAIRWGASYYFQAPLDFRQLELQLDELSADSVSRMEQSNLPFAVA